MASTFQPSTFWDEIRRYGVTIASYTWTLLHELVQAPPHPGERHHPVRLFIGSGMPRGLWRRVQRRFKPARVLEFYASTETGAILVNLRDAKPGSMGRPLPGSAEVRIAAYEIESAKLLLGRDGFVKPCGVDEIGMLLARVRAGSQTSSAPLRGVFHRDDAWLATGDLFKRDRDGDYWRLDSLGDVIAAADGPVFTTPIRDALGDLPAVDLAVVYGVRPGRRRHELAVAAVTVRPGHELAARDIGDALRALAMRERPAIVRVVARIPVTTWFRPLTAPLRQAGIPLPGEGEQAWYLDRSGSTYRPLSGAARRRLVGAVS
jgi:putative long chain acyl-CoA synthase